VALRLLLLKAT